MIVPSSLEAEVLFSWLLMKHWVWLARNNIDGILLKYREPSGLVDTIGSKAPATGSSTGKTVGIQITVTPRRTKKWGLKNGGGGNAGP